MSITDDKGDDTVVLTSTGRVDGRSARKVETRRKIMEAAAALFAEKGFAGTSMDEIATLAGVSKGTIFYNYKNKADVFEQLIDATTQTMSQQLALAREGRRGWEALAQAMWLVLRAADDNLPRAQIVLGELFRTTTPWNDNLVACREAIARPLSEIIIELAEERQAAGIAPVGIQLEHIANVGIALVGALVVATLDRRAFMPDRPLEEVYRGLMLALAGLRA